MGSIFSSVGFNVGTQEDLVKLVESAIGDKEFGDSFSIFHKIQLIGYTLNAGHGIVFNVNLAYLGNGWEIVDVAPCFYGSKEHAVVLKDCRLHQDDEDEWKFYLYGVDEETGTPVELYISNFVQCASSLPPLIEKYEVIPVGLAYNAEIFPSREPAQSNTVEKVSKMSNFFIQTAQIQEVEGIPPVVYGLLGDILDFKEIENELTGEKVYWFYVDTGSLKIEVLVNPMDLDGEPEVGEKLFATVWLQGQVTPIQ